LNLELQVYEGRPGSVKVVGTNDEDTLRGLQEIAVGGAYFLEPKKKLA
jgi:hypothetical protein